jgi:trehalose synthase-fused probable maltokinase
MDTSALLESVSAQRWFAGRGSEVAEVKILDFVRLDPGPPELILALTRVTASDKTTAIYQMPLLLDGKKVVGDAFTDVSRLGVIGRLMAGSESIRGRKGVFDFSGPGLNPLDPPGGKSVRSLKGEQSNSSLVLDNRFFVKIFRRLGAGSNPDLELNRLLTNEGFEGVPPQVGEITYRGSVEGSKNTYDLAIAQQVVGRAKNGWTLVLNDIRNLLATANDQVSGRERREFVERQCAENLLRLEDLGDRTAALHVFLARDDFPAEFSPEPARPADLRTWAASTRAWLRKLSDTALRPATVEQAKTLIEELRSVPDRGSKMRIHGDYHLGQTLLSRRGWNIIDFEGEPARSLDERRKKHSPLKDVAGILRSFSYASTIALFEQTLPRAAQAEPWADTWEAATRDHFLTGYRRRSHEGHFLPKDNRSRALVLAFFELDKALYEINYEQTHRPDWTRVPMRGLRTILRRRRRR